MFSTKWLWMQRFRKKKITELERIDPLQYKRLPRLPVAIWLDRIRSHHNVGSVFRTADAFRVAHVYLGGYTPVPPHRDIHKTALGATETVDWSSEPESLTGIRKRKQEGYTIVGVEQAFGSTPLQAFEVDKSARYLLVLGNEVNGIDEELMGELDQCIEIPQFGSKHSLNISVAAGLLIWHFAAAFGFKTGGEL